MTRMKLCGAAVVSCLALAVSASLINRASTYAHNDPSGAYPHNVFFDHLVPFLRTIGAG